MQYQHALAIGAGMDQFITDLDATKIQSDELTYRFIVITRNENYLCSLFGFFQYQLHYIIMGLVPVPAPFQLPAIDDIAHKIQNV
jgi:hypothetical protein